MQNEALDTRVGLILLPLVAVGIVLVLWLGQRPLRPAVHLAADFDRVGQLKPGARVLIANQEVGKVKRIAFVRAPGADGVTRRRVRVYFYVQKRYAHQVWRNSPVYVSSMSLIGERHLEIDAPPGKPSRPVRTGDVLAGRSPSHLDRLLQLGYQSLVVADDLANAVSPHWRRLRARLDALEAQGDQLRAYRDQARRLARRTRALLADLRQTARQLQAATAGGARFRRTGARLDALGARLRREGGVLGTRLDGLIDRLRVLSDLFEKRVPAVVSQVRVLSDTIAARFRQIRALVATVQRALVRGDGSVGAFLKDKELWDDFKVSGKVIRQEIWRTIARPQKTSVRGAPPLP